MSKCREWARYDKTKNICCLTKSNILNPNDDRHCVHWLKRRQLLFDRITASPEVLAEELVTLDCDSLWFAWVGIGRREAFSTRKEAIAATVAKLKEVDNGN